MSIPEEINATITQLTEGIANLTEQVNSSANLTVGEQQNEADVKAVRAQIRKLESELAKILPEPRVISKPSNGNLSREEALKKRAERFGVVAKKLTEEDKLLKRKQRFNTGGESTATSTTSSPSADKVLVGFKSESGTDPLCGDDAKKKRLARFSNPSS